MDLLLTSGSSQTTSDHAVLNVEEHSASASMNTIVVDFILNALFKVLEDPKKRSHATLLPTMTCTVIIIDYLHKIVNIVPYLTEIDQYSSTLIRVLCPPYCGAVIRDHYSRFHSTDEENPSEVVTSTGQWQAEPIQADCVEH